MDKIAEIAGKLSEAQRRLLLEIEPNVPREGGSTLKQLIETRHRHYSHRFEDKGHRFTSACCLSDKGLCGVPVACGGSGWTDINETGLAVRNYLNGE